MDAATTVARLACDEQTARRIAAYLGEIFGEDDVACAAFEGDRRAMAGGDPFPRAAG